MKKQKTRAAAFLLLIFLPLSLVAQGAISEEPKKDPGRYFSLAIYDTPAALKIFAQVVSPVSAPPTPPAPEKFTFRSLSRDFLKDAGEIWSYPVHIRTRDILPIAGLSMLTGFIIANDGIIHRRFMDLRDNNAWVRAVSPVITEMGSYAAWATAAAFLCVGLIAKDDKTVETGVLASSAMLQSGILVTFLKGMFGRRRPFMAGGVDQWYGPVGFFTRFGSGQYGKYDSFPGGHSTTAFTLATVLSMQYWETVWVPILAYTMATGVALSRETENKHWLSDSMVGGVIGTVIGRMVVLNHRSRYHITPTAGVDHGSLSFALTFSTH